MKKKYPYVDKVKLVHVNLDKKLIDKANAFRKQEGMAWKKILEEGLILRMGISRIPLCEVPPMYEGVINSAFLAGAKWAQLQEHSDFVVPSVSSEK